MTALALAILGGLAAGGAATYAAGRAWRWYRARATRSDLLRLRVISVTEEHRVLVLFSEPVERLSLVPRTAMDVGVLLKRAAMAAEGQP